MKEFLRHLFLPRESNNHRPKLLHHSGIFLCVVFLFTFQLFFSGVKAQLPRVLGDAIHITNQELLVLTNQKRQEAGLSPLRFDDALSQAAALKAKDMFGKNYWAHNSPDGLTPWVFIRRAGYSYYYAGENLARGFEGSADVVNAWVASPSHRENMLSSNYQDVGFAVVSGKLLGEDTVLVVEMFGGAGQVLSQQRASEGRTQETSSLKSIASQPSQGQEVGIQTQPLIPGRFISDSVSRLILFIFIFVLIFDMLIVERKKIIRFVGHNLDHIFFLSALAIFGLLLTRGMVLP